jgi:hypothetical protein
MEIFLFPIIFSIRAAISILLLLRVLSIFTFRFAIDLVQDLHQWSRFISWIAISSYTGRFWWSILQVIFVVPITLYTFFWSVYDFGPKHRKRSLFDILWNPVPGIEFEGRPGELDDIDLLRRRRFNHCILARQIARRRHLTQNERLRACLRLYMTVRCLISIQKHQDYMDMNHTSRCTRNPWASKLLQVNTACR